MSNKKAAAINVVSGRFFFLIANREVSSLALMFIKIILSYYGFHTMGMLQKFYLISKIYENIHFVKKSKIN